jgi:hypothetical protein
MGSAGRLDPAEYARARAELERIVAGPQEPDTGLDEEPPAAED